VTQFEGLKASPPVQYHPDTLSKQAELHLVDPSVSPSSQNSSGAATLESPH